MLNEGDPAPAFSARDAQGKTINLSDFRGRKLVLYFYPKDNTPGCTKEACSFRDLFTELETRGIRVVGVSSDSEASHVKFAARYDLPFTLLSDPDHAISTAYEAYGEKLFMGKRYMGVNRITYLIDENGKIKKIFKKVKPENHSREVIDAFAA